MTSSPTKKSGPATKAATKTSPKSAAAKAAPKAPVEVIEDADAAKAGESNAIKLKDLVARVAEATGEKKPKVKEIVEATLAQIGAALDAGELLSLPGLGKLRVAKSREMATGTLMAVKVKRMGVQVKTPKNTDAEPLAEVGEAS